MITLNDYQSSPAIKQSKVDYTNMKISKPGVIVADYNGDVRTPGSTVKGSSSKKMNPKSAQKGEDSKEAQKMILMK